MSSKRSGISYGLLDYEKYYNKNKPKDKKYIILRKKYREIFHDITKGLFDVLCKEGTLAFPYRLGDLYIKKIDAKPRMKDGKAVYRCPIDWGNTKKLWASCEESRVSKKLVRYHPGEVYYIKFIRPEVYKDNMKYFTFHPVRNISRNKMKEAVLNKKINAFYWYSPIIDKRKVL